MRTITVPPGIGDGIFLVQKLLSAGERFHVRIPNGLPQRGKQLWDMLPQLVESCEYCDTTTADVLRKTVTRITRHWFKIKADSFPLSFNRHLEQGRRIERMFPDLPTVYQIPYDTGNPDVSKYFDGSPTIGIYCSAYSNARHWNMWDMSTWVMFIKHVHRAKPNVRFVFIGAEYDLDLAGEVMSKLTHVPHISTIGEPLPVVVEIMKQLDYFVGFPSGLSILHETLGKPGVMFYPGHLRNMMGTWGRQDRIMKEHIPLLKTGPDQVIDIINKHYNLYDRI